MEAGFANRYGRSVCYGDPRPDLYDWLDAEGYGKVIEL